MRANDENRGKKNPYESNRRKSAFLFFLRARKFVSRVNGGGDVVITFGGTRVYSDGSSGVGGAKRWRSRGFDVPFNDPLHSAVRRIVYRKQRPQKRSTSGDDVIINGDGLVGEREGSVNLNVNPPRSDNRTAYSGE